MMTPITSLRRKALMAYGAVVGLVLLLILLYSLYLSWNRSVPSASSLPVQPEVEVQLDSLAAPHAFNNRSLLIY